MKAIDILFIIIILESTFMFFMFYSNNAICKETNG